MARNSKASGTPTLEPEPAVTQTPVQAKRGRPAGASTRNFPGITLEAALVVPALITNDASGRTVSRLTLAKLSNLSPESNKFRDQLSASRAYGLTTGGKESPSIDLTPIGRQIVGDDSRLALAARRAAMRRVAPFQAFIDAYRGKRLPVDAAFRAFLEAEAHVPADRVVECVSHIVADLKFAGLTTELRGALYVSEAEPGDGLGNSAELEEDPTLSDNGLDDEEVVDEPLTPSPKRSDTLDVPVPPPAGPPKKVFIAHGKNKVPLGQLKQMLEKFKVPYTVAIDEPMKGRPISAKVAQTMRGECSSAIFIFTADELFYRKGENNEEIDVWRPSENVVYELGAASILYDQRIVIFKERRVTFPSDFSDLGYIEFEADQLAEKMGDLFSELVALDVLEVRAKG